MENLRAAADLFAVGEVYPEDLPMIAAEALARGLDSPALVELACMHRNDCGNAPEVFLTALRELDLIAAIEADWPRREADVLLRRARHHAEYALSAEGDTLAAAERIAGLLNLLVYTIERPNPALAGPAGDFEWLIIYWEAGLDDRESIMAQIRRACRSLLDGPPFESVFR
ncbi:hypothetical protein KO481_39305 [Nocardia sp. NEAU-G5]|uniref:Uncharacterized protein n=1 Tax=Nocardia albiluteola TaxID=2842303 RepID=A0ABS6BDK3_9NOCA|nr:hypothetical protein [Nocardia albiluteola]MBU3067556.1 hypothetical protein [Nocardia albiluteola]